jgi:ABC-type transport system substrate-binding protein
MESAARPDVVPEHRRHVLSRRSFVSLVVVGIGASAASGVLSACTPGAPASPTTAPAAGATSAPAAAPKSASTSAAPTGQPVPGGTLTWTMPFGTNIDVMAVLQTGVNQFGMWAYDGLFDWGPDQKVRPMLVKEEQVSADGLTVTWQLQQGVKFHDGTPFNAAAVKWNLERKINKKYSPFDLLPFKTVEVVNDSTTRIKLDHPYAGLSAVLANRSFAMYSPTFVEKNGDDAMKSQASGTGPYMVTDFRTNEGIWLKKNPDYWQKGLPYFDEVVIKIVSDANTRATMLASGDADVATEILAPDFQRFKTTPGIKTLEGLGSQQWYITINTQHPGLDDKRVRQAFNYAVDKEGIAKTIYLGSAKPAQAMFATPTLDGFSAAGVYEYNPEKAKQLLDEAGWRVGSDGVREKDGKKLAPDIWCTKGSTAGDYEITELVQGQLKNVGVGAKLTVLDAATFNPRISVAPQEAQYDMVSYGFNAPSGGVDYIVNLLYSSKAFPPRYYNRAYYSNAEVDKLIDESNNAADRATRDKLYAQILKAVHDDAPLIQLVDLNQRIAMRDNIQGIYLNGPPNNFPAQFAWRSA